MLVDAPNQLTPAAASSVRRFLLRVAGAGLLVAGGGLALVFFFTTYAAVAALGHRVYHEDGFARLALRLTPARYHGLEISLLAGAALGLSLLLGLREKRAKTSQLGGEIRRAGRRLLAHWRQQHLIAKATMGAVLAALVAVRVWYLLEYPLSTDEVASYDYFTAAGPLASTSYYPIPNNHILYNLLAAPLAGIGLSPRLAMRLPTLLLGTVGTLGVWGLLARLTGWQLATLITGVVGLMPMQVYYAAVGRGYFLQLCLIQTAFFSAVELLRPATRFRRLGWFGFVVSSILGFYLIPTFAYPFASIVIAVGLGFGLQRRRILAGELLLAGSIIMAVVFLLYAPVGAISGWDRLLANRYVQARSAAQFWPSFRAVLYERAADLFGPPLRISGPLWLGMAALGGLISRYLLPAGPRRAAAMLAWLLLAVPILLMMAQRVHTPARVLLYLPFFGLLLGALWLAAGPHWPRVPVRLHWLLIVLTIGGTSGWGLYRNQSRLRALQREAAHIGQAYHWLAGQPHTLAQPVRVLLQAPQHELFFAHYNRLEKVPPLHLRSTRTPTAAIQNEDFLVLTKQSSAAAQARSAAFPVVYHDALVTIYACSAATRGPRQPAVSQVPSSEATACYAK